LLGKLPGEERGHEGHRHVVALVGMEIERELQQGFYYAHAIDGIGKR
jgi:hypothetical protein